MLKRKITEEIAAWKKNESNKALCIIGARQIGKTTAVREFARENYPCFLELNFLRDRMASEVFKDADDADQILLRLSALSAKPLIPHQTLILLDEIQECPEARTAVKFLVEDGRYDYIETGSLLGVKMTEIKSLPVGFEILCSMYPMDLEEFAWAAGVQDGVLRYLKKCYDEGKTVDHVVHQQMMQLFQLYLTVGGMPEVVQRFVDHRNIRECVDLQRNILHLYRADITQYAVKNERMRILDIFNSVPGQLNEKNNRFYLSKINPNSRMREYEGSLVWLIESGTVLPSYSLTEPQNPLKQNEKRNNFRLFLMDVGLLCAALGDDVQKRILNDEKNYNMGSLLENAMAELLCANGFELFYFDSKKIGEVDFVVHRKDFPDLVEIKSGNDYQSHSALDKVRKVKDWTFSQSIVFCRSAGMEKDGIRYLPWYMVMFYKVPAQHDEILNFNFESINLPIE